jgi:hypothetical protein
MPPQSASGNVGQQSEPQSDRPAGAAWAALWLLAAVAIS